MTLALTLLRRVVRRRLALGEALENILTDYPKLTEAELTWLRAKLAG